MAPIDMGGFGGRLFSGSDMGGFAPVGSLQSVADLRGLPDAAALGYLCPFYPTTLYSMRKRNARYAGPCLRIRRSSDNAERDIGFNSSGWCSMGAIASFAGSDSAYVTTWYDQSGGGVNLTQPTNSLQPRISNASTIDTLAGQAALNFGAVANARLEVATANAAFGYGSGAMTWEVYAATGSPVTVSGSNGVLLNQRAGGSGADPAQLYVTDSALTRINWYYGSNITSTSTPAASTNYWLAASYVGGAASALRVFLDGSSVINSNITMDFGATDTLIVGRDVGATWQGLIGEVAITKGACQFTSNYTPRSYV